jgi:hypothetical protein
MCNWWTKATQNWLFCSATQRKFLELANKSNSTVFVRRAAKNFGTGEQKLLNWLFLFGHAAENLAISEQKQLKIVCFCSAAQRKILELANKKRFKLTVFVRPRSEKFWNLWTEQLKIDCFCSAAQRKTLQLASKSNSKLTAFVRSQRKMCDCWTKTTQNWLLCSVAQRKFLELANKSNSKVADFVRPRNENFWNWWTEATQLTVSVRPRSGKFSN